MNLRGGYIYNYTDHLGNIRLSYLKNGNNIAVLDENNYYPFGLRHEGVNVLPGNPHYQYQYNGKELQMETGMYDYGARFYMPDIGRWGVVDPLAEKMTRHSPYNYAFNNPLRFIDPDGRQGTDWIRKDGIWQYNANVTTVEQAQKMAGVDGFAKNGTVFSDAKIGSDGEAGYVRLSEGGKATYEPMYGLVNAMTSFIQGDISTWTAEEFPQITFNGGMARTDFDASTHDKKFGNDKTFNLDWGSFVAPSTFPVESSAGGRGYALSWVIDRWADLNNVLSGSNSKSTLSVYNTWTLDKNGSFKTLDTAKYIKNNDSTGFMRFMNSVDEQRRLKIKNLGR